MDPREKSATKACFKNRLTLSVELDTAPREVVVPADFGKALEMDKKAKTFWDSLSYSNKSRHVLSIEGAKTPETRARHIENAVAMLHQGRAI